MPALDTPDMVEATPETATETVPEAKPKTTKKPKAKKAKPAVKATKAAAKPKAAKKSGSNGHVRAKKEGLRAPQIRVLDVLARNSKPLTRNEISEKGKVDLAMLNSYIGAHNPEVRAAVEKNVGFKGLRTLGFVKVEVEEVEEGRNRVIHTITASGRKALEKAKAAE